LALTNTTQSLLSSSLLLFSSSQYKNDSSSFDTRISSSTLTFNDTTGQTGIDFTKDATQISAIASGLSTSSNVQFNSITASNSISASGTVYCDTLVATTLVGATLPVLQYETNGTLGNILIKGETSKAIQVVDTITFQGLTQNGTDQYSAGALYMTGSISASQGFSGSINGIGNVTLFSQSLDSRIIAATNEAQFQTIAAFNTFTVSQYVSNSYFATTGSNTFTGKQTINNDISASGNISASNLYITNAIYAYELHTIIESASVIFSSGSNNIGDQQSDVLTITGSLNQTGSTSFSELTGSLFAFSASLDSRIGTVSVGTLSASIYQTDATQSNNIAIVSASAWGAFQSASSYSSSLATSISASKAEYTTFSASNASTDNTQTTNITAASASAWGAFQSASSYSSSLASRLATQEFKSNTFATTGSNSFTGSQNINGNTIITGSLYVTADVVAYYSSDERLKDNIELISNPIQKVQQLRGVEFDWKDGIPKAGQHDYGVIAQDVIKVMPEIVNQRPDGFYAVDYDKIIGLLIEVVKDQEKRIKELENKVSS
jgi:hypothetical protein